jgi:hypothetical protein
VSLGLVLLVALAQAPACPDGAESCELEIEGTLVSSRRNEHAKWDDLRISTGDEVIAASVNIPNRTRLKLKATRRYRFKVAVDSRDVWVIDAKRL